MGIKPHPHFDQVKQTLQKVSKKGTPFSDVCYRCTEPKFADQIIAGTGSQIHGARWTPKGSFPTVYLCDSVEAALKEYLERGRRLKLPDHRSLPMVMAWVKVKVANILDTTDPEIDKVIRPILVTDKLHWRAVQDRREAVSQTIGRALKELGFAGLIVSSQASAGSRNIVLFPDNFSRFDSLSAPVLKPLA